MSTGSLARGTLVLVLILAHCSTPDSFPAGIALLLLTMAHAETCAATAAATWAVTSWMVPTNVR